MNIVNFKLKIAQKRAELERAEAERAAAARNEASASGVPIAEMAQQKIEEHIKAQTAFLEAYKEEKEREIAQIQQEKHVSQASEAAAQNKIKILENECRKIEEDKKAILRKLQGQIDSFSAKEKENKDAIHRKEEELNSCLQQVKDLKIAKEKTDEVCRGKVLALENAMKAKELQGNNVAELTELKNKNKLEIEALNRRIVDIGSVVDHLNKQLSTLREDNQTLHSQIAKMAEAFLHEKENVIKGIEEENKKKIEEKQALINSIQQEKAQLEEKLKEHESIKTELQDVQEAKGKYEEENKIKIEEKQALINSIQHDKEQLEEKLKEHESIKAELQAVQEAKGKYEEESKIKIEQNLALINAIQHEKAQLEEELKANESTKIELKTVEKVKEKLESELQVAHDQLALKEKELENFSDIKRSLDEASEELDRLKKSKSDLEEELDRLKELHAAAASGSASEIKMTDVAEITYFYYKRVRDIFMREHKIELPELSANSSQMVIFQNPQQSNDPILSDEENVTQEGPSSSHLTNLNPERSIEIYNPENSGGPSEYSFPSSCLNLMHRIRIEMRHFATVVQNLNDR